MRSPAPTDTLRIAAACLFDSAGRLLLVRKRGTHAWMLPGGKLEPGEDALSALTRELQEELDLHLPADALGWLGHFQAMAANEADTWLDAQVYHAHLPHPVHPAAELEALSWLDLRAELPADLAPLLREQVLPRLADSHYRAE
ncbi:MAG TPA: NUDIX domain-containing protein [Pseudomonas sp.]|nr:NUDIX domain-containing protein [Pseudomonas sp.]